MADDPQLTGIVQRMIDAGEPEENIASVIQAYRKTAPPQGGDLVVDNLKNIGGFIRSAIPAAAQSAVSSLDPRTYWNAITKGVQAQPQVLDDLAAGKAPQRPPLRQSIDAMNHATPEQAGQAVGQAVGPFAVGPTLGMVGKGLRLGAPVAMDMGLQRTMADRLEFPNTPQRLVDEGIIPRGTNIQQALDATEQKINGEAAAYDAAHPIGRVDPDTLAQQARDSAFTRGKVGGLGNVPGPESGELDALQKRYQDQNTRSRNLAETIDQKRAYQARASYSSRPNAPTVTNNELNFNGGVAAANRQAAIGLNPAIEGDLAKEQDLLGALVAREKLDAKAIPLSTVGTVKSALGLRNPTVMGAAGIGLDRTGRGLQAVDPIALRAALLQLMASHSAETP